MTVSEKKTTSTGAGVRYPGIPEALDGTGAVVAMETAAGEAAGAYPITPSTQMGEGWALAAARGDLNVHGRRLLFFEPEGEHAAAAVTAGMAMVGLRSANFSSGQGIAYMHESLYAAVGKRLTYVLNMACRAMTKHALNVHAGHDDYHAIDDTGFFQLFAKDAQESADLNLIAHRVAELSLTPGVCAQDGFLTSHVIESVRLPERELVKQYLGDPADLIESPTPAQRMVYGERRRRIPEIFDFDSPTMVGVVQNQDSYAQGVASQRPFFFDHVAELTDRAMEEYAALTGRRYRRASGYRTDAAEVVLLGQGSVVGNAEAVADHLRETRGLKIGVVNLTMFRPFPADRIARLLAGKKAVLVLERVDQPLAVDAPVLREVRAAMAQAVENHRAAENGREDLPYPELPALAPEQVPDFYSACFGLGSRDLQPGDLLAAVDNVLPESAGRRFVYLGVDFVRDPERVPERLREWQAKVLEAYPKVKDLSLPPAENVNLLPEGSVAVRIHSVGGWGAITMGKNLTLTLFDLLGMQVKSNPKYGSEKKGQPTTFYGVFAHEPIRVNCELKHVDVVLSPDPNVFRHSNPLAGLAPGGTFVIQSNLPPEELWASFPAWAQRTIRERELRVFHLDAFRIAKDETDIADLQFRMQGNAFQGAFFNTSGLIEREGLDQAELFDTIRKQLEKKFGHRGRTVVEDNFRVIRRGFDEVAELAWKDLPVAEAVDTAQPPLEAPWYLGEREDAQADAMHRVADPYRFMDQVCALYKQGDDPIADPFSALSAIPAATGIFRDMTDIRFEVPDFVADRCTGCGQCWTQCPDAAIPGLVVEIEQVLCAAASDPVSGNGGSSGAPSRTFTRLLPEIAESCRKLLREEDAFHSFATVFRRTWDLVASERIATDQSLGEEEREMLEAEAEAVTARLADYPLARTAPFFTVPERRQEGVGGLLAVTVNPYACKGCNLCVEVCPDDALRSIPQTEDVVDRLRRNWKRWEHLPDTPDRFLQVSDLDEGVGVLHTLLLKKDHYHSMVGGDGSCMGCGEKTGVHLIVATIEAAIRPRVVDFVKKLEDLIRRLEAKAGELVMHATDLDSVTGEGGDDGADGAAGNGATGNGAAPVHLDVEVSAEGRTRLQRISKTLKTLKDLHWRYLAGPTGRGRSALGITNSTGCSSVWGSTYPYNPYPYPWTNHLFQDAPSIGIGIFEGVMRKMADGFAAVRRAELELEDRYDPAIWDSFFEAFDYRHFTDDEFRLCPPVMVLGGDGAMLDIGFQNVSRLLASGKPLRVVVLDTQVYSNTGGQACTSGFKGQISDMAAYGAARHGKEEQRKELGLIAMAHRSAYVLQSSQALPAHLVGGVLRGLGFRGPALFNIYTPCQAEHGVPDSASAQHAKLALESRAFPYLVYDPTAGDTFAERLDLEGNPALEDDWPTYELSYTDEDGQPQTIEVPLTIADWAATEPRFGRHFRTVPRAQWTDDMVPFHAFVQLPAEERDGRVPFIHVLEGDELTRQAVAQEMVELAEDRLDLWDELRELAGVKVPERVQKGILKPLEREYQAQLAALSEEYEAKIADLKEKYPKVITRRIAEALVQGGAALPQAAAPVPAAPVTEPAAPIAAPVVETAVEAPPATEPQPEASAPEPAEIAEKEEETEEEAAGAIEPWIDTELCTTCNECTNLNPRMFVYNDDKQAYIADPRAGTFQELVKAAERCSARIIHPGTPLDPDEPDLEKWVKRAEPFQ